MDLIFRLSNVLVLPFWTLVILLPRWRWTARIMRSPFASVTAAGLYVALVLPRLGQIWPAVSRPALSAIAELLGSPAGATIAWVHFLAFDLSLGVGFIWIARTGESAGGSWRPCCSSR